MSYRKITEAELEAAKVSSLPDQPSKASGGMTPAELKAAFDALGVLNAERYNELYDAVADGTFSSCMKVGNQTLSEAVSDLLDRVSAAENGILTDSSGIDALESRTETVEAAVDALETALSTAEADILLTDSALTALQAAVTEQDTRLSGTIDALSDEIDDVKDDVDALETALGTLESGIDALESRTETVEQAAGAAVKTEPQSLTDAAKAQARQNIGAAAPDGYYGESGGVMQFSTNFIGKGIPVSANNVSYRPTASAKSGSDFPPTSVAGSIAEIRKIRGKTLYWNQLVGTDTTSVTIPSGEKYRFYDKDGTDAILSSDGLPFPVTGGEDMVTNLTEMYRGQTIPTLAEFLADFPRYDYAYNAGEYIHFCGTGLQTNGFNQLKPDGTIDVFGGLTYRIEGSYTSVKDSEGNAVTVTDKEFTPIVNDTYTVVGTPCIHLKWSGTRDGETETYWEDVLDLPIASYFPDGMKKAGSVYDELTKDKAIQRVVAVDLGTLTYSNWYNGWKAIAYEDIKSVTLNETPNVLCFRYTTRKPNELTGTTYSQGISAITSSGHRDVVIRDSRYTTAEEIKASLQGVYAFFERSTPVETPVSPELDFTYRVDDFGTEELLTANADTPAVPADTDIVYQIDYEAQVRNGDSLNITKESMDAFIAAFNASGIGTITETWDATNKKYAYTVEAAAG